MNTGTRMPDGTVCRTGPSCKRHGAGLNGFVQQLESQIASARNACEAPKQETFAEVQQLAQKHGLDSVTDLGGGRFRLMEEVTRWSSGPKSYRRWRAWYREAGQNVTYMEFSWQSFEGSSRRQLGIAENEYMPEAEWTVCDIEVRESARGQGQAMKAIRELEADPLLEGNILHTSGGFTPEGFHALAKHLPLNRWDGETKKEIHYRSMTFVHDWDVFQVKH